MSPESDPGYLVAVYDFRGKIAKLVIIITAPLLVIVGSGFFVFVNSAASLASGIEVFAFVALVCIAWISYAYLFGNRLEFYNEFVRVSKIRGKPIEIPYSQLDVRWKVDGGNTRCILSTKDNKQHALAIQDISITSGERTLFRWIVEKTGQALPENYDR